MININEDLKICKDLKEQYKKLRLEEGGEEVFKLSQLDYKIHNINKLSQDNTLKPLERAKVAMNKFKKLSQSENNANKNMQK